MKLIFQPNFYSARLIISGKAMAVHYRTIPQCPVIVARGPPQTRKTTAIKIGMSMIGIQKLHKNRV